MRVSIRSSLRLYAKLSPRAGRGRDDEPLSARATWRVVYSYVTRREGDRGGGGGRGASGSARATKAVLWWTSETHTRRHGGTHASRGGRGIQQRQQQQQRMSSESTVKQKTGDRFHAVPAALARKRPFPTPRRFWPSWGFIFGDDGRPQPTQPTPAPVPWPWRGLAWWP